MFTCYLEIREARYAIKTPTKKGKRARAMGRVVLALMGEEPRVLSLFLSDRNGMDESLGSWITPAALFPALWNESKAEKERVRKSIFYFLH